MSVLLSRQDESSGPPIPEPNHAVGRTGRRIAGVFGHGRVRVLADDLVWETLPVIADPWGLEARPIVHSAPVLPAHIAALVALSERRQIVGESFRPPDASELPEVAELAADGWVLLAWDQRVIWPVWPSQHRGWIQDRLPRFVTHHDRDGVGTLQPWSELQDRYLKEDEAEFWAGYDLPAPPDNRLWMVRSPWEPYGVEDLWALIGKRTVQVSPGDPLSAVIAAAAELVSSDGAVLSDWANIDVTVLGR